MIRNVSLLDIIKIAIVKQVEAAKDKH